MIRVFGYLKKFQKGRLLVDVKSLDLSEYPAVDNDSWHQFYPDATEDMPPKMPEPLGKKVTIMIFVDADHAHDQFTHRSVTGILLFLNGMPIHWISKCQKTNEMLTYSSELVAARIAVDLAIKYCYTLWMLGDEDVVSALSRTGFSIFL